MALGSDAEKSAGRGTYLDFGAGLWFGVGTGRQVMPPLDNAQITDKAFLLEGRLGYGWHLNSSWDFGVVVPVSYGYFFKNTGAANDVGTHYQGVQGEILAALRLTIGLF